MGVGIAIPIVPYRLYESNELGPILLGLPTEAGVSGHRVPYTVEERTVPLGGGFFGEAL